MTQIIGIIGAGIGVGKDTAARYLSERLDAPAYAIATELKLMAKRAYDMDKEWLWGTQEDKDIVGDCGMTGRQAMHTMGDALGEVFGKTFLVDRLLEQISRNDPEFAIVSDVRYEHEAEALRSSGAFLIKLHRAPGLKEYPTAHQSEQDWAHVEVDFVITPDAGVDSLCGALDEFVSRHLSAPSETVNSGASSDNPMTFGEYLQQGFDHWECWRCQGQGEWVEPISRYGAPSRCPACFGTGRYTQ